MAITAPDSSNSGSQPFIRAGMLDDSLFTMGQYSHLPQGNATRALVVNSAT